MLRVDWWTIYANQTSDKISQDKNRLDNKIQINYTLLSNTYPGVLSVACISLHNLGFSYLLCCHRQEKQGKFLFRYYSAPYSELCRTPF